MGHSNCTGDTGVRVDAWAPWPQLSGPGQPGDVQLSRSQAAFSPSSLVPSVVPRQPVLQGGPESAYMRGMPRGLRAGICIAAASESPSTPLPCSHTHCTWAVTHAPDCSWHTWVGSHASAQSCSGLPTSLHLQTVQSYTRVQRVTRPDLRACLDAADGGSREACWRVPPPARLHHTLRYTTLRQALRCTRSPRRARSRTHAQSNDMHACAPSPWCQAVKGKYFDYLKGPPCAAPFY